MTKALTFTPSLGYAVNGLYLTRNDLGITRYAYEIMKEMDRILFPGELVVAVPEGTDDPCYENIQVVECGAHDGIAWEQIDFARFLKQNRLNGLNLTNTLPLRSPYGITVLHDISYKVNPHFFRGVRGFASRVWHMINYRSAVRHSFRLATVSEFSKSEILSVYGVDQNNVLVVPNAWQHMLSVSSDSAIFAKLGLKTGNYYYTLSSLAPNKNIQWVIEAARLTPSSMFVVAGGSRIQQKFGNNLPNNLILPGFVTDSESKALIEGCKAFLFPTLYEGFGIPPLEALACGARVIVSDTPCMHEVLGDAAFYVDPAKPIDLDTVADLQIDGTETSLIKYDWARSAALLLEAIRKCHG